MKIVEGELSKSMLENNKCYLLDCGSEVFVWVGRVTQVEDRKAGSQAAEVVTFFVSAFGLEFISVKYINVIVVYCHQEFISRQNKPKSTRITRLIQGYETRSFKSNFDSWPLGSATSSSEEGRGKVAGNDNPKL